MRIGPEDLLGGRSNGIDEPFSAYNVTGNDAISREDVRFGPVFKKKTL